ncbi:TMV resistance protein N-like [Senna tora]|uniref:TMV resistance protein N-like n=1 Tax=Senna tora TaxID=362788 RepID=A0A834WWQ1_9FABA|nr:TMV resistance protein N-like [Senna tora]
MKNLVQLDLEDTGITELPESIEFLAGLVDLNLKYCSSLVGLPRTFHNLKLLKTLNMFGCSNFSEFPERINENEALENLDANETSMNEVPSFSLWSLHFFKGFNLTSLTELNISYCRIDDGLILDDEQLWFFFSSLNHQLRCRTKYLGTQLSDIKSEYLPFRDFYATIPGSEVPSWFPNYMQVREDNRGRSSFSIIVDIPQSFRASEWSGIAVCLLINYDSYGPRFPKPYLCWTCKAPEDDSYISKGWAHVFDYSNNIGRICPHLCLMLFHCNDQTCWQHLRGDNNWLQIVFTAMWAGLIKKCGWRVLCREEMEEWCKTNYECNKLYDAEVGISEVWLPNSAVKKTLEIFQVPPNSNRKRKREE